MGTFLILLIVAALAFFFFKIFSSSSMTANDDGFSQAGVSVNYRSRKITIRGRTYDVDAVQGIEYKKISNFGTEVKIKVDDFKKPVHNIGVTGIGGEGEKFVQRLETALRKAGGPSFS